MNNKDVAALAKSLLDRFLRYARIATASDPHSTERPSTESQWELSRLLARELSELGVADVTTADNGIVMGRLPSNQGKRKIPTIGFMAHVDTSSQVAGGTVTPVVHDPYDGEVVELAAGTRLDPAEFPEMLRYKGETIITADGTSLLGADDKAGIAAIMCAAEYLIAHPDLPHGEIEIFFTTDEEIGKGADGFPFDTARSEVCYTLDGDGEGTIEAECFNAYHATLVFKGKVFHPGYARGKLVNALEMAASFIAMLPSAESPQATDGRYGYYLPNELTANLEEACLALTLRDFEDDGMERRIRAVRAMIEAVKALYPGGEITLELQKSYANMKRYVEVRPEIMSNLEAAIRQTGIEPKEKIIRGGTDGARLSEQGIPTPNVFDGGYNYHSRQEWAALPAMVRAAQVVINLTAIWSEPS